MTIWRIQVMREFPPRMLYTKIYAPLFVLANHNYCNIMILHGVLRKFIEIPMHYPGDLRG
jgi:hypothetical protein